MNDYTIIFIEDYYTLYGNQLCVRKFEKLLVHDTVGGYLICSDIGGASRSINILASRYMKLSDYRQMKLDSIL